MCLVSLKTLILSFIFVLCIELTICVRINRLEVPEITNLGDSVILDCDYTLEESVANGLVVKWYFNEKPTPIYQWIPNTKPLGIGILKGRLNLDYSASSDTNSAHRALHIIRTGADLSGNYTCVVSTFEGEDRQTKRMLVFVPQKKLELRQKISDGGMQILCAAEGIFPKPSMSLRINKSEVVDAKISVLQKDGLFDIRAAADVPLLTDPKEFSCELRVPQANYTVKREAIYYPHNNAKGLSNTLMFLFLCLVLTKILQQEK